MTDRFPSFDLSVLTPDEIEVVVLRCEGVSFLNIADMVGCNRTTAWRRWTRSLAKLAQRNCLNSEGCIQAKGIQ